MALDEDIRNLARVPLFNELEAEALRLLAFSAETKILRRGDVLFRKGEPSDGGYVVLTGSFNLDPDSSGGRIIGVHALVGELALLIGTERPATVVAREPSTVLKISRVLFHRVLKEFPQSAVRLRGAIESRLKAFTADLVAESQSAHRGY